MKRIIRSKNFSIAVIIIVISIIISISNITFLRIDNLIDLTKANIVLAIVSLGMLIVKLTGGIDISVGAIIATVSMIVAKFMLEYSNNLLLVFLVGCIFGTLFGLFNGFLIAKLKLPPIMASLGTMSIVNGALLSFTKGAYYSDLPDNFNRFGKMTLFNLPDGQGGVIGFPIQFLFLIGAAALTWYVLKYTLIGRGIYAMGGNPVSAERVGFNLDHIILFAYASVGCLTGLAAVVHGSIMRQIDPNGFSGFHLQAIAAVVIGGASVVGGAGTVSGTLLGVLLLSILNNGLLLMRIPTYWQMIVVGVVIIIAVSADVLKRQKMDRNLAKIDIE